MLTGPVLVVDDDAVSRLMLTNALSGVWERLTVVSSGTEALAAVDREPPAVVVLDLVMPSPDGYDVLRELRKRAETANVPVIVLTAHEEEEEIARAFAAGADDFLRKPCRPFELVARIRDRLRQREYVHELARRERSGAIVLELSQALSSSLDAHAILRIVVERVAEITESSRVSLVLAKEGDEKGFVVASSDAPEISDLTLDLAKYPELRQALRQTEPLVLDDENPLLTAQTPYGAAALVPVVFEDGHLGVLFLRRREKRAFEPSVLSLACTIANTTAIALRNARVLSSLQKSRDESEKRLVAARRYTAFFESAADGIAVVDPSGKVLFANPSALAIAGYPGGLPEGKTLLSVVAPEDLSRAKELFRAYRTSQPPRNLDIGIVRGDGRRIVVSANGSVLAEDDALLLLFRDVTEERRLASELEKTKGFLESVIRSSADAIISADLSGSVLLFNEAAERCYGYGVDEVIGKMNVRSLYPPGGARQVMKLVRGGGGRLHAHRTEVIAKSGERIPVSLSAAVIEDGGKAIGTVGVFTDLRERLGMEARLAAAQEELRSREQMAIVAELAGAAAHELNQPLTSIMGYAQLAIRKLPEDAEARRPLDIMLSESQRMAEIVRKIGTITRYETKSYVGGARIFDLDKASGEESPPGSTPPPSAPGGAAPSSVPPPSHRRTL